MVLGSHAGKIADVSSQTAARRRSQVQCVEAGVGASAALSRGSDYLGPSRSVCNRLSVVSGHEAKHAARTASSWLHTAS